jgi:DMSO/TMAO reductase YedYZ molybdopterin-dependent catalytic subunit
MQILKRHKIIVLVSLLMVIILAVVITVLVESVPKPSPTPSPSPTSSPSPSLLPTENSPTPTGPIPTPTSTPLSTSTTQSTPIPLLLPGEVAEYQGQTLTTVGGYIEYLFEHPDVAIAGAQSINRETYHLAITGLVDNPVNYTYEELVNDFNSTLQVATLPCVEGWSVTLLWQGVPLTDLLRQTGVSPDANTLIFFASDGYSSSLPLEYIKQNNIMIAYKINNITLTDRTGWPFFLVAKNQYGYKWVEWLTEINVSNNSNYLGYWESRGYPNNATVIGLQNTLQSPNNSPAVLLVASTLMVCSAVVVAVVFSRYDKRKKGNH